MSVTKINGFGAESARYTEMWGIQPATLTGVYYGNRPGETISYSGGVSRNLILRSYSTLPPLSLCDNATTAHNGYSISASSAVADFYTTPFSFVYFDPIRGVEPRTFADAISSEMPGGWKMASSGGGGKKSDNPLQFIRFSGTFASAIDALGMMTGTLYTADHVSNTVISSTPGGSGGGGGMLIDEGYSKSNISDVICYGHLNRLPCKNSEVSDQGFEQKISIQVSAGQWNVSPNPYVSRKIDLIASKAYYATGDRQNGVYVIEDTMQAQVFYVIRAFTSGIRQNEVIMIPKGGIDEDTAPSGNSTSGDFTVHISGTANMDNFVGGVHYEKTPYTNPETAMDKVREWEKEIAEKLSKNQFNFTGNVAGQPPGPADAGTRILFIQPAGSGAYSSDFLFGVHTYVVSAQKSRDITWTRKTLMTRKNGKLEDVQIVEGDHLTDFNADAHQIAFLAAENVLKHLVFVWDVSEGQRILFPYETGKSSGAGVLRIRNDYAPTIGTASSYAAAVRTLYGLTHYSGYLNGSTTNSCKYIEDTSQGLTDKISYSRT